MKNKSLGFVLILIIGILITTGTAISKQNLTAPPEKSESLIQQGFWIAPVQIDLNGKNPALVGKGSYYVNAVAACNDCHTCPSYAPSDNPYISGPPGMVNADTYLAGGVPFGPFISANITPDPANGLPAGLTLNEFMEVIRTGLDPADNAPLQVMPWPVYRNMTDHDLEAIYEYLSSIPHAEPGNCTGAGQ